MNKVILILILFTLPLLAYAKPPIRSIHGTATKVADGDTITVNADGTKVKVRLYGIDTPETEKSSKRTGRVSKAGQPYGEEAFQALTGKVLHKQVRLDVMAVDRYRRAVCIVWIEGRNINREMVADGWGWAYRKYLDSPHASEYIGAEEQARKSQLGLWQDANPLPPWAFRRRLRMYKDN